jgi:hypothetical protein
MRLVQWLEIRTITGVGKWDYGHPGRPTTPVSMKAAAVIQFGVRGLIAIFVLYVGVLMPNTGMQIFGGSFNLVWNDLYGLGFYLCYLVSGSLRGSATAAFGFFFWPVFITALVFWLSGIVIRMKSVAIKTAVAVLAVLSLLINITPDRAQKPPYINFPFFSNELFTIY